MTYCIDTSGIIEPWVRHYPPASFPSLWDRLDELIAAGRLISTDEVLAELARRDDDIHTWAKDRVTIFLPIDGPVQVATARILATHNRLVGAGANRNRADPFVIGTAMVHDATVVTYEGLGSDTRPKIPNVCADYGIPCIGMVGLIQREGWVFR